MENQKQYYNLLIAKKTEKLVTAIYLISQFLKDTENIKNEIRSESNKLLKNINLFAFNERVDIHSLQKECLDSVTILISYLTVARDTYLISKMNCEIIIDSLRTLENILIKRQFRISKENLMILEEDLFSGLAEEKNENILNRNTSFDALTARSFNFNSSTEIKSGDKNTEKVGSYKVDINETKFIKDKIYKGQNIKDNSKTNIIKEEKFTSTVSNNSNNQKKLSLNSTNKAKQNKDRKENRRDQILGLFTKGVEVSINDISKKIVGCSIKTIQRELNDLVGDNRIKRIGDKRWSKYTLNV